jgi:hypothetical protein
LKRATKREIVQYAQGEFFCPECGKPFADINATESHLHNVYELHLKARHGKLHAEAHGKDLATKIT